MVCMVMETTETKYCPGCETELPVSEFHKNQFAKDGLQNWCQKCKGRQNKEYLATEQGRKIKREGNREYRATDRGRENRCKSDQKRRATLKGRLGIIFDSMNNRCSNPNFKQYKDYGGRGIENRFGSRDEFRNYVINELGFTSFEQIKNLQIDRIDNDGHYEKGNIRFVTRKVNANNRRNSIILPRSN